MSKVILLGDTHLGARNGSNHFSRYFNRFFSDVLYPYMRENDITQIIQLGDLFDNRTQLSIKAFNACKTVWFDSLRENGFHMTTLLGNHDIFFKSTLSVNSPNLLLENEYRDCMTVVSAPTVLHLYGTSFALIPWVCDDNKQEIFDFLSQDRPAEICCGHFEIDGFEMMRGVPGHGGLTRQLFDRFEATFSGHYHTRSHDPYHRITYTGTPYELTFADANDPRGFTVFDTETRQIEFVRNPLTMFERLIYSDGWSGNVASLKDKLVKVVVDQKSDLYMFDRFIDSVKLAGVHDLQIIENFSDLLGGEVDASTILSDPRDVICKKQIKYAVFKT
jgi:DNA repair exonuclease SbcCD nuclease subunit